MTKQAYLLESRTDKSDGVTTHRWEVSGPCDGCGKAVTLTRFTHRKPYRQGIAHLCTDCEGSQSAGAIARGRAITKDALDTYRGSE